MEHTSPSASALYITYDGLLEPLGQSQVLPYLRGLAGDWAITVMSFEKPQDWQDLKRRQAVREQLDQAGIEWKPLRYHKRPSVPATAFDIVHGVIRGLGIAVRRKPGIVHVRSYVPGVMGLALKKVAGARFIFDMRGFWPDEKVDAGAWRCGSRVYRTAKWIEKKLLQKADVVVSLTQAGVSEMQKFPYLQNRKVRFEVIPTCTDLELFRPAQFHNGRERQGFVLGYVGSVGTFYLFGEGLECFLELLKQRADASLLIVKRGGHDYIRARLKAFGVPSEKVQLHSAEYGEVPEYIRKMDAGAFFIRPTFSKKSSAPTRLGEFLGCGVPCLVNAGVGDVDAVVSSHGVGVVMREFTAQARRASVHELLKLCEDRTTASRCVDAARRRFSLEEGVASYRRIYRDLAGQPVSAGTHSASRVSSCAE